MAFLGAYNFSSKSKIQLGFQNVVKMKGMYCAIENKLLSISLNFEVYENWKELRWKTGNEVVYLERSRKIK